MGLFGEFLALIESLRHLSKVNGNNRAKIMSDTLENATEKLLTTGKSPKRKVGELDNRGSHYYLQNIGRRNCHLSLKILI